MDTFVVLKRCTLLRNSLVRGKLPASTGRLALSFFEQIPHATIVIVPILPDACATLPKKARRLIEWTLVSELFSDWNLEC